MAQIALIRETTATHGILGTTLNRTYEVTGMRNTAGYAEVYRVFLQGQYNDGSVRFDVQVQRPNGAFAMLDRNKHWKRCSAAFAALNPIICEYKKANKAVGAEGGAA